VLTVEASQYPNISITGHLMMYRFRKNIWTLYVENGVLDIWFPYTCSTFQLGCSAFSVPFKKPIKIIAVDTNLWTSTN
jgi:hypothetical protein